jgi:hypothetical protein
MLVNQMRELRGLFANLSPRFPCLSSCSASDGANGGGVNLPFARFLW